MRESKIQRGDKYCIWYFEKDARQLVWADEYTELYYYMLALCINDRTKNAGTLRNAKYQLNISN